MSRAASITLRAAAAVGGGYALMVGVVALGGLVLPVAGIGAAGAVLLSSMIGILLYLAVILWSFHARSPGRVAAVIGGGAVATIGAALLLAPAAT